MIINDKKKMEQSSDKTNGRTIALFTNEFMI